MYQILVDISADPITGFERKVEVQVFTWSLPAQVLSLNCLVTFYKDGQPLLDQRFAPYAVPLIADNAPTEEYPDGEYNHFIQEYASSPIILPQILSGIVLARDAQGRFNV